MSSTLVAKVVGTLSLIAFLIPVTLTMSRFTDLPGVYDDMCYLRQAHLFQRLGVKGLDTDLRLDDDGFFANLLKTKGVTTTPCHHYMPLTGKLSMQYPPGTGFALSLFPSGIKRAALFIVNTLLLFGLLLYWLCQSDVLLESISWSVFGCVTIYFMINPTVMSDSMPATMALCSLTGIFTPRIFADAGKEALSAAGWVGLLLGILVDFRIANSLLLFGYLAAFIYLVFWCHKMNTFVVASIFGFCFLIGLLPTLAANAINAGSPFSTAYAGADAAPPTFDFHQIGENLIFYARGNQGVTLLLLFVAIGLFEVTFESAAQKRSVQVLVYANLAFNLTFFLTHPVSAAYYTMPMAMLLAWTILPQIKFQLLDQFFHRRSVKAMS